MENLLFFQFEEPWLRSPGRNAAGLSSLLIHAGAAALIAFLGTSPSVRTAVRKAILVLPADLLPVELAKPAPKKLEGGGGGGDRSRFAATRGRLPKIAPRQFTPPMVVVNNPNPRLIMEPSIVIPPDSPIPNVDLAHLGDPYGVIGPFSNGTGYGGGIGDGGGGGVGKGIGPGTGPGPGTGFSRPVYKVGGAVSAPVAIYSPEPEYSEEARKAKVQGTVLLYMEIDEKGRPRNIRVLQPFGLGLEEKAIEAVSKWRFKPGLKGGQPVAVGANIEVNFRLL